jgi:hypothetical protein
VGDFSSIVPTKMLVKGASWQRNGLRTDPPTQRATLRNAFEHLMFNLAAPVLNLRNENARPKRFRHLPSNGA